MFKTPIAYIVFNRPRHTERSFAILRELQPSQLYIISDGPRPDHPTDAERCAEVRAIVEWVNWPCEVHRHYAESNLGCKARVSSGLDWVFAQVEQAIILEDDCLPHPDFFEFCETLLDRYANDSRVWVITGDNFQNGSRRGRAAYYFSKYNHVWGWATWRRAWGHYSGDLAFWPQWKESRDWRRKVPDRVERQYWTKIFDKMYAGEIDTWDYPWVASVWYHGGLTATPNVNLVTNIGFGPDATHTREAEDRAGQAPLALGPLTHPDRIRRDRQADRYVFDHTFGGASQRRSWSILKWSRRIAGRMYRAIKQSGSR